MQYLSLGENCLPDDILKRYKLKSFSTPYSPARSNIEYAIHNEQTNYNDLIKVENLVFEKRYNQLTACNLKYPSTSKIYHPSVCNGFEFAHHNVISDLKAKDSFIRKIDRIRNIKSEKVVFLYHYRYSPSKDLQKIYERCLEFIEFYEKAHLCLMTQTICANESERSVRIYKKEENITLFDFYTKNIWEGNDPEIFWARCDDDLIQIMINYMKNLKDS